MLTQILPIQHTSTLPHAIRIEVELTRRAADRTTWGCDECEWEKRERESGAHHGVLHRLLNGRRRKRNEKLTLRTFFSWGARERNDERRFSSVYECLRSWEIQRVFDDNSLFFHDSEKLTFYTAQYYSLVNFCERDKWQRNCSVCCAMRERRSSRALRAFSANVTVDRPAIEGGSHGQWTTDERGQFK